MNMEPEPLKWGRQKIFFMRVDKPPPGSFSAALKMVRDRKSTLAEPEQLIDWKGSNNGGNSSRIPRRPVPSLQELALQVLAQKAEYMVSLEVVPSSLTERLADVICDHWKMDSRIFELVVRVSSGRICIKDCSLLTEEQFLGTFENLDAKSLQVLQLEQCRQFAADEALRKTVASSPNSLPILGFISLKGACQLSDNGLKALVISAPALQSVNLSQCGLLTHVGINFLAESLGSILRELYINYCPRIDAMLMLPSLKKFKYLEVLSVAGIQTVGERFVYGLLTECGHNIKKLDFADCRKFTNYALKIVGDNCKGLLSLNISNLDYLTELGLEYLADGCKCIETLKLCRNEFSDDKIAAFLEASGGSLKELSLHSVAKQLGYDASQVGSCTAFSLAKCSRKLLSLDVSWCNQITDQALGFIVDSCLSLQLLKLFGCVQITDVFLNGYSNPNVYIVGLQSTSRLEIISPLEPSKALFGYSPLNFLSDITATENSPSSLTTPDAEEEKRKQTDGSTD